MATPSEIDLAYEQALAAEEQAGRPDPGTTARHPTVRKGRDGFYLADQGRRLPFGTAIPAVHTIGADGDFDTINDALARLSRRHAGYGTGDVELRLLSGFTMAEQVVAQGCDLGWVTITAEDSTVDIDETALDDGDEIENERTPLFLGTGNATLPTIGCLFEYDPAVTGRYDGIAVMHGSRVRLLPGAGVNNASRGLAAHYDSHAFCYMEGLTHGGGGSGAGSTTGVSFKNCRNRALMASHGSSINAARSQLQDCEGDNAVYVVWGSFADIYQSDVSGADNTAVHARDGSKVNARETDVSGSNRGFHALHGSTINARYKSSSSWAGDGAKNCAEYGVLAHSNSHVSAPELPVDGSDFRGAWASDGSSINISGGTATNCASVAVGAKSGGSVNADGVDASDCGDDAFYAEDGSTINAADSTATDAAGRGYYALAGSIVNAPRGVATGCGGPAAGEARDGSTLVIEDGDVSGASNRGLRAWAATVSARGCDASGASSNQGVLALDGGIIHFRNGNARKGGSDASDDIVLNRGGFITAHGATGGTSHSTNTTTSDGIIFQ